MDMNFNKEFQMKKTYQVWAMINGENTQIFGMIKSKDEAFSKAKLVKNPKVTVTSSNEDETSVFVRVYED